MGELTFFLGLQVKQKQGGIFISQDKYVYEILKKFGFSKVKTTSTLMETQKPLLKDEDGEEMDVHIYRSMIGLLINIAANIAADEAIRKEGVTVCDSLLAGVNTPRSDEDRPKHIELMKICTTLLKKVLELEDELKRTKTTQQTKIGGSERRVKKLKKKQRLRTHKLKRLYKVGVTAKVISSYNDEALDKKDTSKQGRIDEIDVDEDIALEEVVEVVTTAKMIINAVVDATQVTTTITDILVSAAKTIVTTTLTITTESTKTNAEVQDKGKGKAKLIKEPEMPKKRKHQIKADKELAEKLHAEMQVEINEENRLARERELERNKKQMMH
nr:ribonuclease H-like domain, reverse transcriptase, RNA-dependent DNA polymerase [Tanacetum cinerariifolium]